MTWKGRALFQGNCHVINFLRLEPVDILRTGNGTSGHQAFAEFAKLDVDALKKELDGLLRAQFGLRMQLATQSLTKNSEIQRVKRMAGEAMVFSTM
mgnify:CR=1 FL=1